MKRKLLSILTVGLVAFSCGTTTTSTTGTDTAATAATGTMDTTVVTTTTVPAAQADVPTVITTTFTTRYPNATNAVWSPYDRVTIPIDWEMTGWSALDAGDYVVEFDQDGQHYYAWFDASGKWIGSSSMLANHGDLPKAVRDLLVTRYNGYTIDKVEREYEEAGMVYEIKLKKTDDDKVKLHVSEQGTVLKEKKKD
ncbi:MAG TPA: PepSY-like domain-containing protein [Chitinophagaceae bacterium]